LISSCVGEWLGVVVDEMNDVVSWEQLNESLGAELERERERER